MLWLAAIPCSPAMSLNEFPDEKGIETLIRTESNPSELRSCLLSE